MAKYRLKTIDGRLMRTGSRAEAQAIKHFTDEGWTLFKRGWPDMLIVKDNQFRFIEVKKKIDYQFKPDQKRIAEQLKRFGLEVEIWAPPNPEVKPSNG
jgi:hypothetical protein